MDLFLKVQDMRNHRRIAPKHRPKYRIYILSGLARCDYCGNKLAGEPHNNMRYLADHHSGRSYTCPQPAIKAEVIESQVINYVGNIRLDSSYETAVLNYLKGMKPADDSEQQRAKLKSALDGYASYLSGVKYPIRNTRSNPEN